MYRIIMLTEDVLYGSRLEEYWNKHCGNELALRIVSKKEEISALEEADLILLDGDMDISSEKVRKVTLVSETKMIKEPYFLSKYGKPQELYHNLLELCQSDEIKNETKFDLKNFSDGKENFLELGINDKETDQYAIKVLKECPVEGLIPIKQGKENKDKILYYIHGKISLNEYMDNIGSERQLIQILKDIFDILIKVEDYMLNRNQLLLDINHIYLHQITKKPSLIYIPSSATAQKEWLDKYQELLTQLSKVSISDSNDETLLTIKVKENMEETFVMREALDNTDKTEFFQTMQKNNKGEINIFSRLYWISRKQEVSINRNIFKIGREPKFVDFCIEDNPSISRNHADIVTIGKDVFIIDKETFNHTYVNGKQIPSNARIGLKNGDVIRMADEEFIFYR